MNLKKMLNGPEGTRLQAKPRVFQKESGGCTEHSPGNAEPEMMKLMAFPWLMMG